MKSLNEIDTISKRSSRAAGYSWGISEEVGKNMRLLEISGLPGIKNLNVTTAKGLIPVSSFIDVVPKENRQTVSRENGQYFQQIAAGTVNESEVTAKVKELDNWLKNKDLGVGVSTIYKVLDNVS